MVALENSNTIAPLLDLSHSAWERTEWGDTRLTIDFPKNRTLEVHLEETPDGNGYYDCGVFCSEDEREKRGLVDRLLDDFICFIPQDENEAGRIIKLASDIADRPTDDELEAEEDLKDVEKTLWHALNIAEYGRPAYFAGEKSLEKCDSKELRAHSVELVRDYMSDQGKESLGAEEVTDLMRKVLQSALTNDLFI